MWLIWSVIYVQDLSVHILVPMPKREKYSVLLSPLSLNKAEVTSDIGGSLCDITVDGNTMASFMYLDFPLGCFHMLRCNDTNQFVFHSVHTGKYLFLLHKRDTILRNP